ncbi:MAG: phosphoribosyltransferase family protein [Acidimicrobiia bacterium]
MIRRFRDRREAGALLADALAYLQDDEPLVLALPRGGVPVAFEVAQALGAPLDVIVVRKLGVPFHPELGMGAIGEGGVRVLDPSIVRSAQVTPDEIAAVEARERVELERRVRLYRGDRAMASMKGRTVIVVDDGIATGSTARAALRIVREHGARRVVLAVPVGAPDSLAELAADADDVVAVAMPTQFLAIGQWYDQFGQTSDDEVRALLQRAAGRATAGTVGGKVRDNRPADTPRVASREEHPTARAGASSFDRDVEVSGGRLRLPGHLTVPADPRGLVLFAHGSGSSRLSPRNRYVAERLRADGLATLQFDLLSPEEARERGNVFDVELLAVRLLAATSWCREKSPCRGLDIGYFGASTGAAAALWAAAEDGSIGAVVSRGGRPDLAAERLGAVTAPTLLVVGGNDPVVLDLNRQAAQLLRAEHELVVVPRATHLFEEPGTLEEVARLAGNWFVRHFAPPRRVAPPAPARPMPTAR